MSLSRVGADWVEQNCCITSQFFRKMKTGNNLSVLSCSQVFWVGSTEGTMTSLWCHHSTLPLSSKKKTLWPIKQRGGLTFKHLLWSCAAGATWLKRRGLNFKPAFCSAGQQVGNSGNKPMCNTSQAAALLSHHPPARLGSCTRSLPQLLTHRPLANCSAPAAWLQRESLKFKLPLCSASLWGRRGQVFLLAEKMGWRHHQPSLAQQWGSWAAATQTSPKTQWGEGEGRGAWWKCEGGYLHHPSLASPPPCSQCGGSLTEINCHKGKPPNDSWLKSFHGKISLKKGSVIQLNCM